LDTQCLSVLETSALLREDADRRIRGRIEALPEGGAEVSCRSGCHACCYQLVVVSPMEACAIAAYVETHPDLAEAVADRLGAWQARVSEEETLSRMLEQFEADGGCVTSEQGGLLEQEYWKAQIPCPFLEEGRCAVYPVRPFACREHYVLSDPATCSRDPDAVVPAGTRLEFRAVAEWVGSHCFNLEERLVLLPQAIAYAQSHLLNETCEAPADQVQDSIAEGQRRSRRALALLLLATRSRD
jgi:Fe-S-cluster containining protein